MTKLRSRTSVKLILCLLVMATVLSGMAFTIPRTDAQADIFTDVELRVGDKIGVLIYTTQEYTSTTSMLFEMDGHTPLSVQAVNNNGKCVFIYNEIYPHELTKTIKMTLVKDGKEVVTKNDITLKSLLLNNLLKYNSQGNTDQVTFANALLNYGEATRRYRNAHVTPENRDEISITDDINTSVYTAYKPLQSYSPSTGNTIGVSSSTIRMASIGIAYENTNHYAVTVAVPRADISSFKSSNIKVVFNVKGNEQEVTSSQMAETTAYDEIPEADTEKYAYFVAKSNAINAYDLKDDINITLKNGNTAIQKATYNVQSYLYELKKIDAPGLAIEYATALYRYSTAATQAYEDIVVAVTSNKPALTTQTVSTGATNNIAPESSVNVYTIHYLSGNTWTPSSNDLTNNEIIKWMDISEGEDKLGLNTVYNVGQATKKDTASLTQALKDKNVTINELYSVERTLRGTLYQGNTVYKTPSGRTFEIPATMTLLNPINSITNYESPVYRPNKYVSSYTPQRSDTSVKTDTVSINNKSTDIISQNKFDWGQVNVTWANGHTSPKEPTSYDSLNCSNLRYTAYNTSTIRANFKNPCNESNTKTANITLFYYNPIKAMSATGGSVKFTGGDANIAPSNVIYTVTFQNGSVASNGSQSFNNAAEITFTDASYSGTQLRGTVTSTSNPGNFTYEATIKTKAPSTVALYASGKSSSVSISQKTWIDNTVSGLTFSNPEEAISLNKGSLKFDITGTDAPFLSINTSDDRANDMIIAFTLNVTLGNGKTIGIEQTKSSATATPDIKNVPSVNGTNARIKIVASKGVTGCEKVETSVNAWYYPANTDTYTYIFTNNGTSSGKTKYENKPATEVTMRPYIVGLEQIAYPIVEATASGKLQLPRTSWNGKIQATYSNGMTTTFSYGTANPQGASLNITAGGSTGATFYTSNVTSSEIELIRNQYASTSSSATSYPMLKATCSETTPYGEEKNYSITLYFDKLNDIKSITTGSFGIYAANYNTTTLTWTKAPSVTLSNDKTITHTFTGNVPNITDTEESAGYDLSLSYKRQDNKTITGSIHINVYNPVTSIERWTDPSTYTVTSTSPVTSNDIKTNGAGKVKATFRNGRSGEVIPSSFVTTNAFINDTSASKQATITACYKNIRTDDGTKECTVKIILKNPPQPTSNWSAKLTGTGSTTTNRLILNTTGRIPSATITIPLSNTKPTTYTVNASTIYKSGTTSSTADATTKEAGTTTVTASKTIAQQKATYQKYSNGAASNVSVTINNAMTGSKSLTAYWYNNPSSFVLTYATSTARDAAHTSAIAQGYGIVTYTNGAKKKVSNYDKSGYINTTQLSIPNVNNITNTTYSASRTFTGTYTATSGVSEDDTYTGTITNPLKSLAITDKTMYFSGTTTISAEDLSITATLSNLKTIDVSNPDELTASTSYGSASISGGDNLTVSYSGTDRATYVVTVSAEYTWNGVTKTDTGYITINNTPTLSLYDTPEFTFNGGSTTKYSSSSNFSPYWHYRNGQIRNVTESISWITAPKCTVNTVDSLTQTQNVEFSVTLPSSQFESKTSQTYTKSFTATTTTWVKNRDYEYYMNYAYYSASNWSTSRGNLTPADYSINTTYHVKTELGNGNVVETSRYNFKVPMYSTADTFWSHGRVDKDGWGGDAEWQAWGAFNTDWPENYDELYASASVSGNTGGYYYNTLVDYGYWDSDSLANLKSNNKSARDYNRYIKNEVKFPTATSTTIKKWIVFDYYGANAGSTSCVGTQNVWTESGGEIGDTYFTYSEPNNAFRP